VTDSVNYWGIQVTLDTIKGQFIDHRVTYEETTNTPVPWTGANLRVAASLPTLYQETPIADIDTNGTDPSTTPANSTWRRKRPREIFFVPPAYSGFPIYAYSEKYDTQSNPCSAGDIGWHIDGAGCALYVCIDPTIPSWQKVTDPTAKPDMLDNSTDSPTTITSDGSVVNGSFPPADNYRNWVNQGDYLGSWLFEEARQIANLLRYQQTQPVPTTTIMSADVSSTISYADACSKIAAVWTAGASVSGPSTGYGSGGSVWASFEAEGSGGTWFVSAQKWSVTYELGGASPLPPWPKQIDIYVMAGPDTDTSYTQYFSTQSDDVLNGFYHKVWTSTTFNDQSITTVKIGDETIPPTDYPPDPEGAGPGRKGYFIDTSSDVFGVVRFDVPGGLEYLF
jgi:hypothetical protein